MAGTAGVQPSRAPRIVYDSQPDPVISVMEVDAEVEDGTKAPPSFLCPEWRNVDFSMDQRRRLSGLGLMATSGVGSTSFEPDTKGSLRPESPTISPELAETEHTLGWSMPVYRKESIVSPEMPAPEHTLGWSMPTYRKASIVSPETSAPEHILGWSMPVYRTSPEMERRPSRLSIENVKANGLPYKSRRKSNIHDARRRSSIAKVESFLRTGSVAQAPEMEEEIGPGPKSEAELEIDEESDILGPLQSQFATSSGGSLPPSSPRMQTTSQAYFVRPFPGSETQSSTVAPPSTQKSSLLEPASIFRRLSTFTDLQTFSFGSNSKDRKQSTLGQAPDVTSPTLSATPSMSQHSSAHPNMRIDTDAEEARDVLLINPVTGERKMSTVKLNIAPPAEALRRPSLIRKESASQQPALYTMVRRESVLEKRERNMSGASRKGSTGRALSTTDFVDVRHASTASGQRNPSFATNRQSRHLSAASGHRLSASHGGRSSNARTLSGVTHTSTIWSARTMSSSAWSRTMSTISRSSIAFSANGNEEPVFDQEHQVVCPDEPSTVETDLDQPRKFSLFESPLFGNFKWTKRRSSDVVLPVHEPEPAYQEALADVEEDPDFVEVPVVPKAGSVRRRASSLLNIFSNADIDIDPDLQFEPSASEKEIKSAIAKAQAARGARKMLYSRNVAMGSTIAVNAACIALSFGFLSVWYALIPLVLFSPLLKSFMILNIARLKIFRKITGLLRKKSEPEVRPMSYVTALFCSNESQEELLASLDSITDQNNIDMHKQMIIIFCSKARSEVLLQSTFNKVSKPRTFSTVYQDEEISEISLVCYEGQYKNIPCVIMVSEDVLGKRNGLNLVRNLLYYTFNNRDDRSKRTLCSSFVAWWTACAAINDFSSFDYLISTSTNTILDLDCISELYRQILKNPDCVAASSIVKTDTEAQPWNPWNMYQNANSVHHQLLQQSHQSHSSRIKSTPSACQLLKICEETCGPEIIRELLSHKPSPTDHMLQQLRSLSNEEGSLMQVSPGARTKQAIHAITYIHPVTSSSNFFSGCQQFLLLNFATNFSVIKDKNMGFFDRLGSIAEILALCLPAFSIALMANFIRAAVLHQTIPALIVVGGVLIVPWLYTFVAGIMVSRSRKEGLHHVLGCCLVVVFGPFVAIVAFCCLMVNLHRRLGRKDKSVGEGEKEGLMT